MQLSVAKAETLETNAQVVTQNFDIGEEEKEVLIEILRNSFYTYPVRTLCQEYLSNARDAHREVGQLNPIQVTLPSRLEPTFKVKDFGPGVSEDRMAKVFLKYGASTKRGDNFQTGGFGVGAKSAWAYTDSFCVTTTVDGITRSYVMHTGVDNKGQADLLSKEITNEPNGTEIQVAVKPEDVEEFRRAIFRTIYFWKEAERPKLMGRYDEFEYATPGERIGMIERVHGKKMPNYIDWVTYGESDKPIIVMDGIPYPLESLRAKCPTLEELLGIFKSKVILHIDTGVLAPAAHREGLRESAKNIDEMSRLSRKAIHELKNYIQEPLTKATTIFEWVKAYENMQKDFHMKPFNFQFNGYTMKKEEYGSDFYLDHPDLIKLNFSKRHYFGERGRWYKKKIATMRSEKLPKQGLPVKHLKDLIWRNEHDKDDISRISQSLSSRDYVLLVEPSKDLGSIMALYNFNKMFNVKHISTLEYTPEEKERKAREKKEKSEIKIYTYSRYERKKGTIIDPNRCNNYLYCLTGEEFKYEHLTELVSWVEKSRWYFCTMAATSIKRIQNNPRFMHIDDYVKNFKIKEEHLAYEKNQIVKNRRLVEFLKKNITFFLKDKIVTDMVAEYDAIEDRASLPKMLRPRIDLTPVYKFGARDNAFKVHFKRKYKTIWLYFNKDKHNGKGDILFFKEVMK